MFALAEHLGKTIAEIEQMTIDEWHHWLAYFKIKKQHQYNKLTK
ncbi:hypothetical protein [Candidatus Tisiphia endosymbiont of Oplodontha viridula]